MIQEQAVEYITHSGYIINIALIVQKLLFIITKCIAYSWGNLGMFSTTTPASSPVQCCCCCCYCCRCCCFRCCLYYCCCYCCLNCLCCCYQLLLLILHIRYTFNRLYYIHDTAYILYRIGLKIVHTCADNRPSFDETCFSHTAISFILALSTFIL